MWNVSHYKLVVNITDCSVVISDWNISDWSTRASAHTPSFSYKRGPSVTLVPKVKLQMTSCSVLCAFILRKFILRKIHKKVTRAAVSGSNRHQIVCRLGLRPRPNCQSLVYSQDVLAGSGGGHPENGRKGKDGRKERAGREGKGRGEGKGKGNDPQSQSQNNADDQRRRLMNDQRLISFRQQPITRRTPNSFVVDVFLLWVVVRQLWLQ